VDVLSGWPPDATAAEAPETDRLLDTLARRGIALEITAAGDAPDERLIHRAQQRGVRFVLIGEGFEELRYALDQARRGWLEKEDVLNTRNGRELRTWLGRAAPLVEP
jgi:DNA polymerase (family X)